MLNKYLEISLRKGIKVYCGKIDNILLQNTEMERIFLNGIDTHNIIEMLFSPPNSFLNLRQILEFYCI